MSDESTIWRNPPLFGIQEISVTSLSETMDWGLRFGKIPDQWTKTKGEGVTVAVLDTGCNLSHKDLQAAILDAQDFTFSRFGPEDMQGHGSHVSGTIGARQNDVGVIGVAPECKILVGKVLGDDGSGSTQSVVQGILWAIEKKADIISMSLGSPVPAGPIMQALQQAVSAGLYVVCAAGNDGPRVDSVNYPAKWAFTVSVGAVMSDGTVAPFSSRGPEVDICAPGQDILSTYKNGTYAKLSGTSMATPFVSGVVALAVSLNKKSENPTFKNNSELKKLLQSTAIDAGAAGEDPDYGYGLIDPGTVLSSAVKAPAPPVKAPGEISWGPIVLNGVTGRWVFRPDGK